MLKNYNVSQQFFDYASSNPNKIAFVEPISFSEIEVIEEKVVTYGSFYQKVANYREGLIQEGFKKGDRIIILSPINIDFYACMLAMLSLGLVGVFLDPGIGVRKILVAISDSQSQAIISLQKILKFWMFIPALWKMKKYSVDKEFYKVRAFERLYRENSLTEITSEHLSAKDHVLITFTSGSTGRSKGADRNARNVYNQLAIIKSNWACEEHEVDLPIFLMFGFMNLLCGITTILPAADYQSIGDVSPAVIVAQMKKWKVSRMSGSYTFNKKLSDYLLNNNEKISTLKNLVLGGTPVTKQFCENLSHVYPNSLSLMTYGSTEVAPISFCPLEDLLTHEYSGSFVGQPCKELIVKIVHLPARAISFLEESIEDFLVDKGKHGEVIIKGPHVVQHYLDNPKADLENKIADRDGQNWHRSGDTGYFDTFGNLILTGRLSDTIHLAQRKIQPYAVENQIDSLEGVHRSALIQKKKRVILAYEGSTLGDLNLRIKELLDGMNLLNVEVLRVKQIPMDDRHNSKINRLKLKGTI